MVDIDVLRDAISGRELPGGRIAVEPHEAAIGDVALRAEPDPGGLAHPIWFVIASLRGMGITVDELCLLAHQQAGDLLLFGTCEVVQDRPMLVGATYSTAAWIGDVDSRTTRDGSRLDSVEVVVTITDIEGPEMGRVTSTYLFKRRQTP